MSDLHPMYRNMNNDELVNFILNNSNEHSLITIELANRLFNLNNEKEEEIKTLVNTINHLDVHMNIMNFLE